MELSPKLTERIAALGARYGAERVVLFGSRARGDNRERSDIDLAVFGLPERSAAPFRLALEELPTLLKCDVVLMRDGLDSALAANIERDGVTIYEQGTELSSGL